jgi:ribosomal protein S18 acetylase RimI-like enzyme
MSESARQQKVYRRVADLHIACINQGFLATLGPRFLSLLYQAIDESTDGVLIIRRDGEQIVGFVAGAYGTGSIYRGMLRHWFRLISSLAPAAASPRKLWRIFEILGYGRNATAVALPRAELLAIAVDGSCRGRGHAAQLYQNLCEHFRSRDIHQFKIVVGSTLYPAHRFYGRMGATRVATLQVHRGETSIVYCHSI